MASTATLAFKLGGWLFPLLGIVSPYINMPSLTDKRPVQFLGSITKLLNGAEVTAGFIVRVLREWLSEFAWLVGRKKLPD